MVVRSPFDYLLSSWKQGVAYGLLMPLEKYFETMDINFQRIYFRWAAEFSSVDLLELRKDIDFKRVASNYFLHQHGVVLNDDISPSRENAAMFRLLTCNAYVGLAKSKASLFDTTSINLSWDPQNTHLPPFDPQAQKERIAVLKKLEFDILNSLNESEIAKRESEIFECIRQSLSREDIPPAIPKSLFWGKPLN